MAEETEKKEEGLKEKIKEAWEMGKPIPASKYYKASEERLKEEVADLEARVKEMEAKKEYFEKEKELLEREKEIKKLVSEVHPSIRHQTYEKVKEILGGVAKEIHGTPEERAKRREKLKHAAEEVKKFLEEQKAKKGIVEKQVAKEGMTYTESAGMFPAEAKLESPLSQWAKAVREERGD